MKTSSFGALIITPRAFASSSAKQYSSPVFFPVLHERSRMFCLFQPSIWRMTDASRRGDIFGSFVPYPMAVGEPCMATSKNVFNGLTALIFTASGSSLGKAEKPFSKRIIPPVTILFKSSRASAPQLRFSRLSSRMVGGRNHAARRLERLENRS